jgi:large subunit ribosomal protein L29
MNVEKIRNLGPNELQQSQRDSAEQLFRLKFQMKMGQTTGLKKMRELRKDLARIKTITRERELGISGPAASDVAASPTQAAPAASAAARTATRKSVARKKSPATKKAKSAAPKKAVAKKTKKKAGAKK